MENTQNKESLFRQMFITRTNGFIDISKKKDFWNELSNELNGELKTKKTISKDLEKLYLNIPYKQNTIEFTESDTHPLIIECTLKANTEFEFMISFEDTIEKLLKIFGQQDIEIGDKLFDDKYLIKEKNTKHITHILSENQIKTILLKNNVFSFGCSYQKNENTLKLSSLVSRTINSKDELSELYKLFSLTIDKMGELNLIR
jgi:predicted lactoylglutathione lyase